MLFLYFKKTNEIKSQNVTITHMHMIKKGKNL
jgi:hypothetical protein